MQQKKRVHFDSCMNRSKKYDVIIDYCIDLVGSRSRTVLIKRGFVLTACGFR